ncbi:MAG: hypothetical protein ILNGONEN_02116 [Syntrophorhabdaceae bacterium]|jgi:hypothetical protein|nr:hypothetical protein [Syntrophorhabdaceae bacterium]HOG40273.1 hypothetical protein [Syntrophorhabdaceae bacterium]
MSVILLGASYRLPNMKYDGHRGSEGSIYRKGTIVCTGAYKLGELGRNI